MVLRRFKTMGIIVILVGIIGIAFSGAFMYQGISKGNMIQEAMVSEKVTYGGADGEIDGLIDTPGEAQVMANILKQHRTESYGYYSELGRDDPARQTILNAMTMENSLNLAQLGSGLADVVIYAGVFFGLIGIAFIVSGISLLNISKKNSTI